MDWRETLEAAKLEVVYDLAVIVAGKQLREHIAFLRGEIERVEAPREFAVRDRDKYKDQLEKAREKYSKLHAAYYARFRPTDQMTDKQKADDKALSEQGRECQVLDGQYASNERAVIFIDRKLEELRAELHDLERITIPEPKHLDLLREVFNGKKH